MASVFKKPGSPFFYAAYRGEDGQRKNRSTKTTKRGEAMEFALKWEKLAAAGRHGTLTEAQARRVVDDILRNSTGESLAFHSCRDWLTEWLKGKTGSVEGSTLKRYKNAVESFLSSLGARADLTLAAITPKDVRGFRDSLMTGRSATTVNMLVNSILFMAFGDAVRNGFIQANPCSSLNKLKGDGKGQRDVFTTAQIVLILDAADDQWKGVTLAGYFTGLRLRDIAQLRWENIDMDAGTIAVTTKKTGAKVLMPIHPQFATWLREQPRGIGKAPLFPKLVKKRTDGCNGLSDLFKRVMKRAGVAGRVLREGDGTGHRRTSLSFHSLRHSFVSALANAGVAPELRKKLSGHADDKVHAVYTHHEIAMLRGALEKVPVVSA